MSRYPQVYSDKRWKGIRALIIQRDNGLCQHCLKRKIHKKGTECHHVIWLSEDNLTDDSIVYGIDNIILLCGDCHQQVHDRSIGISKFTIPVKEDNK